MIVGGSILILRVVALSVVACPAENLILPAPPSLSVPSLWGTRNGLPCSPILSATRQLWEGSTKRTVCGREFKSRRPDFNGRQLLASFRGELFLIWQQRLALDLPFRQFGSNGQPTFSQQCDELLKSVSEQ